MPPFLHKCLACTKLTFNGKARSQCKHCQSTRLQTFRVVPHQPEYVSRRELIVLGLLLTVAVLAIAFR